MSMLKNARNKVTKALSYLNPLREWRELEAKLQIVVYPEERSNAAGPKAPRQLTAAELQQFSEQLINPHMFYNPEIAEPADILAWKNTHADVISGYNLFIKIGLINRTRSQSITEDLMEKIKEEKVDDLAKDIERLRHLDLANFHHRLKAYIAAKNEYISIVKWSLIAIPLLVVACVVLVPPLLVPGAATLYLMFASAWPLIATCAVLCIASLRTSYKLRNAYLQSEKDLATQLHVINPDKYSAKKVKYAHILDACNDLSKELAEINKNVNHVYDSIHKEQYVLAEQFTPEYQARVKLDREIRQSEKAKESYAAMLEELKAVHNSTKGIYTKPTVLLPNGPVNISRLKQ